MKKMMIWAIVVAGFLAACNGDSPNEGQVDQETKDSLLIVIDGLEARAFAETVRMDKTVGNQLMKEYINYSNQFHNDSLSSEYLFKAGGIARNLKKFRKAIEIYQNVHDGFPNYHQRTEAMFLIAFIYDNDLNDRERAKEHYELVIDTYPEHKFAQDAAARLETLHMTDDQLIEYFEQKNQETSDATE